MRISWRSLICVCFVIIISCIISCEKKKEGKVAVTESEFTIRADTNRSFVIDARGKVKNIGEVDVKKVVVTGYCRSCGEATFSEKWFVSDVEKTMEQKDIISYLSVGDEEEFSFREVAFCYGPVGFKAPDKPDLLEVEIVSFETVND